MTWFATTPEEIARHQALVALVHVLRESLLHGDGEWGQIDLDGIKLVAATPGLVLLAYRLEREVDDGSAPIAHFDVDLIAEACGQYVDSCWGPEEAPSRGTKPEMDYRIAVCRLACGLDIWTDEDRERELERYRAEGIDARIDDSPLGPITLAEHEDRVRRWAEAQRARLLGLARRSVQ